MFRDLHPKVRLGTASDRYSGWIGQIYSEGRYTPTTRAHSVGGKTFREDVLPIESVGEYFTHFRILELDFTFYSPLLGPDLKPSRNFHVLETYGRYLNKEDRLILKVPQTVCSPRLLRAGSFVENRDYLNVDLFTRRFYEPATEILGPLIGGFVFEQGYQPERERIPTEEYIDSLDRFLDRIPKDDRYHIETRTEAFHVAEYFNVLRRHGAGHVLSHWTWLPPLRRQFLKTERRFFNSGRQLIIRLMTPLRVRYEDAYARAFPFDRKVEGMMSPEMVRETVEIMRSGVEGGIGVNVVINNRAGGNAPLMAEEISRTFLEKPLA